MKAGQDKSIKTLTPNVSLTFVGGAAPTVSNTNFEILNSGTGPHGDFINLLHTEKISVAGIQAEDLSMTSVGTAIVPLATLAKQDTGHAIDVRDMHIVSTAPVGDVVTTVAALNLGIYDLAPIDMTRVLMCSITDYSSDPSGGLNLINRGSSAWGGATSFSTDLIYVYRYLTVTMRPFYDPTTSNPYPIVGPQGFLGIPQTMVVAGVTLEDFNAVQTAFALYRANDLQQTFDN